MLGPLYSEGSMFSLMGNNCTQCGGPYISVGVGLASHTYRAGSSDWEASETVSHQTELGARFSAADISKVCFI
jgi:hypothetical protein